MDERYKWNLTDIYEDTSKVDEDFNNIAEYLNEIVKLKGSLKESSDKLLSCYNLLEKAEMILMKIDAYSTLKYHQNMANSENVKLYKKMENLLNEYVTKTSFITPEVTDIDDNVLLSFLKENEGLRKYSRIIEKIIKNKKHVLSKEAEYVVSKYSTVLNSFDNIYTMLNDVDFKFGSIKDENGNDVQVTHGTYTTFLTSKNREVRKAAFDKMYEKYKEFINTLTENYLSVVKEDTISASLRNYSSSLEKAVDGEDSTVKVYDSLINTVNANLALNHRYMKLKKKLLNIDKMHMYDVYVNTLDNSDEKYTFEDAKEIVKKALTPLGKDYLEVIDFALENRWIDVYESENKYSGGYSMGVYGVHPYILLNYTDDIESVSTTAHELGHTMHSYLASKTQDFFNADYTIMVAEVASTVNEILLAEYQIANEKENSKKAALINSLIDRIRATLIRQTMFAEFEKDVHLKVESGITLSADELCDIYYNLNKKYFGEDVVSDDYIKYEWARIPHFYRPFYVYKYATGISSAIAIATRILKGDKEYTNRYINMLKCGGSKDSLDLLKDVDVNLETTKPVEDAFKYFEEKLQALEDLLN
mgnify:FL=1